ncbi:Potassium channel [Trichinella spiralis]|uniref:Potassium channel n=1 Tax=Trichinella spiralis TaxID=6334 RepID=A0ABR3KFK5_TRISP
MRCHWATSCLHFRLTDESDVASDELATLFSSVARGVARGYLFENLENFYKLPIICRRRSPKHSPRANILPEA